jgi:hypothetical protein
MCHAHALARHAEQLDHVVGGELRVREDHVARSRRVAVLGAVHPPGARMDPVGEAERDEVVDHRRADAGALRRVHPVREVEHVEAADEPLCRRPAETAPRRAPRVGERQPADAPRNRNPVQRLGDHARSGGARRREGDDLVLVSGHLDQTGQRPADVVADARSLMRERRDVERDLHGAR